MVLGTPADLAKARDTLVKSAGSDKQDYVTMIAFLRLVRELEVNEAEAVSEYGSCVLRRFKHKLGADEYWQLHEDVAIAALQCGLFPLAKESIAALDAQFPGSVRVQLLKGMRMEANGDHEEAIDLYDSIVAEHPDKTEVRKRQIAVTLASGNNSASIDAMCKYLDVFQTDHAAWAQLSSLYIKAGLLDQATFCLEEGILHMPGSIELLLKLADLLYAQGGAARLTGAKAYYCRVVELSKGENVRALYGVGACCSAQGSSREDAKCEVADLCGNRLLAIYTAGAADKVPLVECLLEVQGRGYLLKN